MERVDQSPTVPRAVPLLGQQQVLRCMALALLLAFIPPKAEAQVWPLQWQCGTAGSGVACPANNTYPLPIAPAASTSGGATTFRSVTLTNTAVAVKTSAGTVSFIGVSNNGAAAALCYLHFYDVAQGSVTVGTTTPTISIAVGGATAQNIPLSIPIQFSTAITVAATTTAGGSTACSPILSSTVLEYK